MTAIFYTATCFLDISLDVINVLKTTVDLHVLIEIHPGVKKFNIIDVDNLPEDKILVPPSELLDPQSYTSFEPYFTGLKSVYFVVHPRKSISTFFNTALEIRKFVQQVRPDVLHLEAMLIRSLSLMPSIFYFKKLVISIHDPVPHSGEKNRTESMIRSFFLGYPMSKYFLFYSRFAREQFVKYYQKPKVPKGVIQMKPYTYFNRLGTAHKGDRKHILFFGRLSKYKGVDVLLESMPSVFTEFPDELLIIAGRSISGFELNKETIQRFNGNITLLDRYISNEELVQLIMDAKFIVCPYTDATQSGVLMTAFALNTPVIATDVGAFPEYIQEGITGLLVPVGDHEKLAFKIRQALRNDFFREMEQHIMRINNAGQWFLNKEVLLQAYGQGN